MQARFRRLSCAARSVDPDAETFWATEIRERLKEHDEGRIQGLPWCEVRAFIVQRQRRTRPR